jgi:hypothetical protein
MTSPYPPGPYVAAAPAHHRGRRAIQVGIVLLALAVVAVVIGIVIIATRSLGKVNDFQRITVTDQTGTVSFDKSGGYVAYYESKTVSSDDKTVPLIGVTLKSPSGQIITVDTPYGGRTDGQIKSLHYGYNGHNGIAMWQFHISETGTYQVQLTPNSLDAPDAKVAFGTSIAAGTAAGAGIAGLGVLFGIAGLITLIVGLVRRGRHKSELAGQYGGGYPGGYGGAAPGAPWPPAPYQQPQAQPQPQQWPIDQQQPWPPAGQPPAGQQPWPPAGQPPAGQPPAGQPPAGQQPWPQQPPPGNVPPN